MTQLYTKDTQAIFWNNNKTAIQRMLDYDYTIKRETPSVAAIVAPTSSNKFEKFFWGGDEVMIPLYKNTADAKAAHPNADVLLNFGSFRTAYDVTMEALEIGGFSSMMITAEGIPERLARKMNATAREKGVVVIGPATVGAITPGAFKVANIGGTISNIINSKLHRAGSCGLVTRSGGLFNELSNIISINADGIAEGVAIGGDRFVGSVFIDNLLRMEKNPEVKYMILLGEVGGTEEYKVIEAVKNGNNYPDSEKNPRSFGIQGAIEAIDHLTDHIRRNHAKIGAVSNEFKLTIERVDMLKLNIEQLQSDNIDTDIAKATMKLNSLNISYQALLASIAKINKISLLNYL